MRITTDMLPALGWAHGCLESWMNSGRYSYMHDGMVDAIKCISLMMELPDIVFPDSDDSDEITKMFSPTTQTAFGKVASGVRGENETYAKTADLLKLMSESKHVGVIVR